MRTEDSGLGMQADDLPTTRRAPEWREIDPGDDQCFDRRQRRNLQGLVRFHSPRRQLIARPAGRWRRRRDWRRGQAALSTPWSLTSERRTQRPVLGIRQANSRRFIVPQSNEPPGMYVVAARRVRRTHRSPGQPSQHEDSRSRGPSARRSIAHRAAGAINPRTASRRGRHTRIHTVAAKNDRQREASEL